MRYSRIAALAGLLLLTLAAIGWISHTWLSTVRPEALLMAVKQGDAAEAERLLTGGANPNTVVTPYLRQVNSKYFSQSTLLVIAVANNDLPMAKVLLRYGASPLVRQSPYGDSPTLAQIARGLPAPWPALLNDPAHQAPPPTWMVPTIDERSPAPSSRLLFFPTGALLMVGVFRFVQSGRWFLRDPIRGERVLLQGLGIVALALIGFLLISIS